MKKLCKIIVVSAIMVTTAAPGQYLYVDTYSGSSLSGFVNGTLTNARFDYPYGVTFDGSQTLYVADAFNNAIRKIDMGGGQVTTLAGSGAAGFSDGIGTNATFNSPTGLYFKNGFVYVADNLNNAIRKIDVSNGTVTTVAGNGASGLTNGPAISSTFYQPKSLVVDNAGDIYVADYENHVIRKISGGNVTTFAGTGLAGSSDGPAASAQFWRPRDLAFDGSGNLYVTDLMNNKIRKISGGVVSTFAGSGVAGGNDGPGINASFNIPTGIEFFNGDLYVSDAVGNKVRKLSLSGWVSTIAGSGSAGYYDGALASAQFNLIQDLALDNNGSIYIGDRNNNCIRVIATCSESANLTPSNYLVSNYSGTGGAGFTNGSLLSSSFNMPYGLTFDGNSNIYVADAFNHSIRKIDMISGQVTTLAGSGIAGSVDGTGTGASFYSPTGVFYKNGFVYVADNLNNKIRKIDVSNSVVTTVAGTGSNGLVNGPSFSATFYEPKSLAVDNAGNIFVADYENHVIRKISGGTVTTFAGTGSAGFTNGSSGSAQFWRPRDIVIDPSGDLYVADLMNHAIRKISAGNVSTLAGNGSSGGIDGTGPLASFSAPVGIDFFSNKLYVLDATGYRVREVTLGGIVKTIAGTGGYGGTNGTGANCTFTLIQDLAIDNGGCLFISDRDNHRIRKICSVCDTFTVGMEENYSGTGTKDGFFNAFPNPSTGKVNLVFSEYISNGIINIYDLGGKLILTKNITNQISEMIEISGFENGFYFIHVISGTFSSSKKMLLNK